MRYVIATGMMVLLLASLSSMNACSKDEEEIAECCVDFCDTLVEAMDKSDYFDIQKTDETIKHCKSECTDTINGLDSKERNDVEDCVDCVEGEIDKDDDWQFSNLYVDASGEDCDGKCLEDDLDPGEKHQWEMFWDDFKLDFDEHWSFATPSSDGDTDMDIDTDSDSDTDSDTDTDCAAGDVDDCTNDLTDCNATCSGDTDCTYDCFYDFCDCIDAAGCDPADYGC